VDAEETRKVSVETKENLRVELPFTYCFFGVVLCGGCGKGYNFKLGWSLLGLHGSKVS
jgi:hypothetical protein